MPKVIVKGKVKHLPYTKKGKAQAEKIEKMHKTKQSFWYMATGGRMK